MTRNRTACAVAIALWVVGCAGPEADVEPPSPAPTTELAFTVSERDLLPENIAFDPLDSAFYIGSSRHGKIVKVAPDGTTSDFTLPQREDGLWMVMGMKVDPGRRHLWVASSDGDNLLGFKRSQQRAAGIFQFDLTSGELLRKWILDAPGAVHFFNDLVVTPEGNVYATHMFNRPVVYVIGAAGGELEIFARPGNFSAPNGIALGEGGTVYVAHREGLSAFNPATAMRTALSLPVDASFSPIDGLYFHRGDLIGVHPEEGVIRRFELDGTTVTGIEVLEDSHPAIDGLTTGVLIGDALYFVANSQFDRLENGNLPEVDQLDDIVVLKLELEAPAAANQ